MFHSKYDSVIICCIYAHAMPLDQFEADLNWNLYSLSKKEFIFWLSEHDFTNANFKVKMNSH